MVNPYNPAKAPFAIEFPLVNVKNSYFVHISVYEIECDTYAHILIYKCYLCPLNLLVYK